MASFPGPTRIQSQNNIPPDPTMAVGPSNVVVTVNNAIAWYDKNGTQQSLQSLDKFFGNNDQNNTLFDSRVVYDPFGGHFYALSDYRNIANKTSSFFIAESQTNDLANGWRTPISFSTLITDRNTNVPYWPDYPTLSVDAYAVYITGNYLVFPQGPQPDSVDGGSSTRLFILDKNISSTTVPTIYDPEKQGNINIWTPQAALVYGSQAASGLTGTFLVAYQQNNGSDSFLYVIKTTNAATGAASFSTTPINVGRISDESPLVTPNFGKQPSGPGIDAGNGWVYSAVWRDGKLYATTEIVIGTGADQRAVVHWFVIDTNTMTLLRQGNVTADDLGPITNTYYGNITVNSAGQFAIGFAASSPTLFPGAYYTVYDPNGNAIAGTQTLAAGQASYLATNGGTDNRWGDYSGAAVDPFGNNSFWFFNEYGLADPKGGIVVSGQGFLDSQFNQTNFVWSDANALMSRWQYDPGLKVVGTTALGNQAGWKVVGSAPWRITAGTPSTDQMLMNDVPNGTMTLWWITNGALTGIDLGQRWIGINYITDGKFTANGGTNFLVNNAADAHLYDWWIDPNDTLQGVDLTATSGVSCSNVALVAGGRLTPDGDAQFTPNGTANILVNNTLDGHLYNWWIDSSNRLQGIDLGAYWSNVAAVGAGKFTSNGGTNLLVNNTLDNHLYDWWIDSNNKLQGIDLTTTSGASWSNLVLVAVGNFDNNNPNNQLLIQNTLDHHLYDWWITPQGGLTGIDLTASSGIAGLNVQVLGVSRYNDNSTGDQLLVHNTLDGHFYQWWINNNQLAGVILESNWATQVASTTPPPASAAASLPSPDSTALLAQSMASFGASGATISSTSPVTAMDLSQQSSLAVPTNSPLLHA
jgi:hypothetical protein